MGNRSLRLVVVSLFVFLAAGCSSFGTQPEAPPPVLSDPRLFFAGTVKFDRLGDAGEIMNNAERLQKMVAKERNDSNMELGLYQLYIKADPDHNHVITEQEAKMFWQWYLVHFDLHAGPINFERKE